MNVDIDVNEYKDKNNYDGDGDGDGDDDVDDDDNDDDNSVNNDCRKYDDGEAKNGDLNKVCLSNVQRVFFTGHRVLRHQSRDHAGDRQLAAATCHGNGALHIFPQMVNLSTPEDSWP